MVTIKDIAQLAQVSIATVSKIKNGNDQNISSATRDKVKKIMKELNYVPNAVATGLKIKQTKTLGFILPDIRNPFFPEIARGIEDIAWANHFSVTFCNTDNDSKREIDAIRLLQSKMVDGIIVTKSLSSKNSNNLENCNLPIVVVDRKGNTKKDKIGEIVIDSFSAFFDITNHLISKNCKNIAYISAKGKNDDERFEGFKKALNSNNIHLRNDIIYHDSYDTKTGYEGVQSILKITKPDAIVCGNDLIAVGAMGALRKKGISIPKDIKITGFDDIYISSLLNPSLTTIKQPAYEMGAEAAKMLIDHIINSGPLHMKKLDYQLVIRESTSEIIN